MRYKEQSIQMNVVQYIRLRYPNILYSISGAGLITNARTGGLMKKLGYRAGTPDLIFFEPKGQWHGLMIELKQEKGHPTPEQKQWIDELNKRGYKAVICYGFEECVNCITSYLTNK